MGGYLFTIKRRLEAGRRRKNLSTKTTTERGKYSPDLCRTQAAIVKLKRLKTLKRKLAGGVAGRSIRIASYLCSLKREHWDGGVVS